MTMKKYENPIVDLLYLANEDVLTTSDPFGNDIFPPKQSTASFN